MATEKKKPSKSSHGLEDGGVQLSRCVHTAKMEEHISHIRSDLNKQEEELKSVKQESNEMKKHYEDQLQRLSSALHQKQQEIQMFTERGHGDEQQLQTRMIQMENYYKQELHKMSSALFEKGKEADFYKHSVSERENYLQRKLEETRSILQQKDEELKSFKDRVAGEVALSIKTGKTESMNNPVSKNRLKEMYNDLRVLWPTIKNHLKSNGCSPELVKAQLQRIFTAASEEMEQQKSLINQIFGLNESDGRQIPQKVNEYRKATVQYLQLTLYHNRKDEAESKVASLPDEGNLEAVMDFLDSHCQWLGKLLALNDPPLQPDWENHDPGMNVWDILPRNISSSTSL